MSSALYHVEIAHDVKCPNTPNANYDQLITNNVCQISPLSSYYFPFVLLIKLFLLLPSFHYIWLP